MTVKVKITLKTVSWMKYLKFDTIQIAVMVGVSINSELAKHTNMVCFLTDGRTES